LVWILITTFMVVVGTGHCSDASAAHIDYEDSSECRLLNVGSLPVKSSLEKVTTSSQFLARTETPLEQSLYKSFETLGVVNGRALGSSVLADMRFSGTSPPIHLVR
jgi:hypothetical protein